jgi:hypothetical protein
MGNQSDDTGEAGADGIVVVKWSNVTVSSAPQNLTDTSQSTSEISLDWDEPSNWGGEQTDNYNIYRGTGSGKSKVDSVSNQTTYSDTGLSDSTQYFYEVTATNSAGESPRSNEASATTAYPFTIDGEQITGVTIDGSPVTEVTIDGSVVWKQT